MPAPPPFTFTRVEADEWRAPFWSISCTRAVPTYLNTCCRPISLRTGSCMRASCVSECECPTQSPTGRFLVRI